MLKIEELQKYVLSSDGGIENHALFFEPLCEALPKFSKEDIYYSLDIMEQAGFISMSADWSNNRMYYCAVNYMTYAGHEFLDSIRDPKHWRTIKSGLSAVCNFSLSTIASIAEGVTTAAINAYLQNN